MFLSFLPNWVRKTFSGPRSAKYHITTQVSTQAESQILPRTEVNSNKSSSRQLQCCNGAVTETWWRCFGRCGWTACSSSHASTPGVHHLKLNAHTGERIHALTNNKKEKPVSKTSAAIRRKRCVVKWWRHREKTQSKLYFVFDRLHIQDINNAQKKKKKHTTTTRNYSR